MARFSGVSSGTVPANTNVLVATTLPKLQKQIVDQFFQNLPFFQWLRSKNRILRWTGGDTLEIPLMYGPNPMAKAYSSYETLDVKPPEGITVAIYGLVHYRVPIFYSRSMAAANRGESQIVNLIQNLRDQARLSLNRVINADLFASSQSARAINSMYTLLEENDPTSQTATVGGITKSAYSWWRHQYKTIASASPGLLAGVRELYLACSNGTDTPDLGLCDTYTYQNLENQLYTAYRIVNTQAADWGWDHVTYKGMTITWDKSISDDDHDGDGDGTLFLINSNYMQLAIGDADFRIIPPEYKVEQDAYLGVILADLQVVVSQMRCHGVLQGGAYSAAV